MKSENKPNQVTKLNPAGYVALPFNENQFKEFVVGLLGKPQSISGSKEGIFEIELDDIRNIYSLLNQRINQQNDSHLISFNSSIVFSDDTTVLLNSIEELLSYSEIKPVVAKEIHLTFVYLIQFFDKDVPEKQEINLSFVTSKENVLLNENKILDIYDPLLVARRLRKRSKNGYIQYSIKHTARTWGSDLDALLSNHLTNLLKSEPKSTVFFRENGILFGLAFFFFSVGLSIFYSQRINKSIIETRSKEIREYFSNKSEETLSAISQKLEYMANLEPLKYDGFLMILISFFIGAFGMIFISESFSNRKQSHILLTKESIKYKEEKDKEYSNQLRNFIFSIIISIVCSVLANYLFEYFN